MMATVKFYECYDFNNEWNLVEMVLDVASSEVDWAEICVPQDDVDRDNWQCAFMEQYLGVPIKIISVGPDRDATIMR